MFSPLPTALFLLLFILIEPTAAQDQPGRWDVLKGMKGESSCDLQSQLSKYCLGDSRRQATNISIQSNQCTCNKVFFNIWSACSYSSGNNTLPVYSSWVAGCQASSVSVNGSAQWILSPPGDGPGIMFPEWAKLDVPGGGTFDMMRAVSVAIAPPRTPVGIIASSAAAGVICTILAIFLYRRWRRRDNGSRRTSFQKLWYPVRSRRLRSVEQEDPKSDWTIDRAEEPQQPEEEFVFVQPVSPTSPTPPVSPREEPLRSRWSDSVHAPSSITGSQRSVGGTWGESIAKRVRAVPGLIPIPWKPRRIQVMNVPARRGFRVDTHDRNFGFASPSSIKPNRFHETIHEDDEEQNHDVEGHQPQQSIHEDDDERMTLISDHDRTNNDVFLVSRNGADFNTDLGSSPADSPINSSNVVVTPIDDMHSPQRPTPSQRSKKSARSLLPPPPSHPPPAIPRTNYQSRVEGQKPASRLPPPINTLQSNGVGPSHSPSALLPVALERSESNIRRHQPSIDHSHYRSPSLHDPIDIDFEAASITRKSSNHSYRTPLQHQRSISHSPLPVVDEGYHDPFAPSGHRRGLSADDTVSFYLTAENSAYPPSPGHQLSAENLIPRRTDPVMLFPGSVRGMGYGASDVYPQLPPGALQPNRRENIS